MSQRLAELLCILTGHRLWFYETELYGLVVVCSRCMGAFDAPETSQETPPHDPADC